SPCESRRLRADVRGTGRARPSGMSITNLISIRTWLLGAAVLTACVPAAQAQTEVWTGVAAVKSTTGVSASAPLPVTGQKYSSDADRDALVGALRQGGSSAAQALLAKGQSVGTLQLGTRSTPIKYAYARVTERGQLVTVITAQPIVLIGAGFPDAKPAAG